MMGSSRCLGAVLALATLLAACGGGDAGKRTHNAPAYTSPDSAATPSPQGPYGIITTDGILVKARDVAGARAMTTLFRAVGAVEHERFDLVDGLSLIDVAPQNVQSTLAALQANPAVAYAEPNYVYSAFVVPNDPDLSRQYHLTQTSDADIDAPEAWDLQTGNNTVVAVIDSGVDYNHQDLANNIWSNPGETANNGVDDDNNGFVDDVRGWDFANNDNDPMDDNRHGTHVSGIIAAQGNNGTGGSGVAWRARIMPLKFLDAAGSGSTANAIRAVQYATRMGAKVSNNSWGGPANSQALSDAINAANQAGMVFVAAAGNAASNNDTTPSYPASYQIANVISVAATTNTDTLASFSNFGARTVHVAAPGNQIYSTVPNNSYALLSGTSMATPVVTGIVALLLSQNPSLTVSQMTTAITSTVDPVTALNGRVRTNGRVNAFRALQSIGGGVGTPQPVSVTPATGTATVGSTIQFQATGGTPPFNWSVTNTAVGTITTTGLFSAALAGSTNVIARDSAGVQGQATATVTAVPAALALTPRTSQLSTRQTAQLTASGGTPPYRWASSNTAVASVSTTGVVTAVAAGTAVISVTDNLGATQSTTLSVVTAAAVLPVAPASASIGVGKSIAFSVSGATPPVTWSSASSGIATVDATTGVVTGVAIGSTTINMADGAGNTGSATVAVKQVTVQISPTSTVAVGATISAAASGGTAPYIWSSDAPAVAAVNASTGVITGISAGTAAITATDASGIIGTSSAIAVTAPSSTPVTQPTVPTPVVGTPAACTTAPSTSPVSIVPSNVTLPATWWVHFMASGGTPPYVWIMCSNTAGEISETTGWFHAGTQLGAAARVVVQDATGKANVATVTIGTTVSLGP